MLWCSGASNNRSLKGYVYIWDVSKIHPVSCNSVPMQHLFYWVWVQCINKSRRFQIGCNPIPFYQWINIWVTRMQPVTLTFWWKRSYRGFGLLLILISCSGLHLHVDWMSCGMGVGGWGNRTIASSLAILINISHNVWMNFPWIQNVDMHVLSIRITCTGLMQCTVCMHCSQVMLTMCVLYM